MSKPLSKTALLARYTSAQEVLVELRRLAQVVRTDTHERDTIRGFPNEIYRKAGEQRSVS